MRKSSSSRALALGLGMACFVASCTAEFAQPFASPSNALGSISPQGANEDLWASLRDGIDSWRAMELDVSFTVVVGLEGEAPNSKPFWEYSPPVDSFSMLETWEGASYGKWVCTAMLVRMIQLGVLSFDDTARDVLDWWTQTPTDPRYNVTLRHLLSFTAGFEADPTAAYQCPPHLDYVACANASYHEATRFTEPGKLFKYLAIHLQIAGAMASVKTGLPIETLLQKYAYEPFHLARTSFIPKKTPLLAVGIVTCGTDVLNFLRAMLNYSPVSKPYLDIVETDVITPGVNGVDAGPWFGHYGLGHYWECLGYATPSYPKVLQPDCLGRHIQAGPGELGLYPLLDRSGGGGDAGPLRPAHYFAIVLAEPDSLAGVPEYLRIVAKPVVEFILNGTDPATLPRQHLLDNGGGLIARDVVYLKSVMGNCTCENTTVVGEPFTSLLAELPDPKLNASINRRDILAAGHGLTLLDIARIQKPLGACNCSARANPS